MTVFTTKKIEFARSKGRKIEAEFSGGNITSDGGILLLKMADQKIGLINKVAGVIEDPRDQNKCDHDQVTMLRQRIFGLALGYEDLNDHDTLRKDKALQVAVEKNDDLANSPTLCRLENRIKEQQLYLFSDRTSCTNWFPNQLRVLLSGIAYTLLQTIRRLGLCHTDLAKARCDTIRLKLLKIGAVIIENTRRVRFLLSSAYPWQGLFRQVVANLEGG